MIAQNTSTINMACKLGDAFCAGKTHKPSGRSSIISSKYFANLNLTLTFVRLNVICHNAWKCQLLNL